MTVWLFDLGNTRLKCAPLQNDGRVGPVQAIAHTALDGADAMADALARALPPRIGVAHVASVASEAQRVALLDALTARCGRIGLARTQPRFAGLRIAYAQPQRLGVDRFLAMLGARAATPEAVLVCGVGTALTLDLVDAAGGHRGGRIAPSPTLMRESLHARAAQLPIEGGAYREFADDTLDALASGCEGAALALIRDAQHAAQRTLGATPRLIVHGGGAAPLLSQLPDAQFEPSLVLDGLAVWAQVEHA
ncbi:type III pantothenate kinase [Cognatilysobacter bugurensis]|uniref:Type III pantothenate kinase n=1 Tax=Cognatilysobacter bugurensis TaxID=543356 RepID=A0A918T1F3_9GAMM|nr:type III pantothenate kinase [Lysobacter bugurensis]GHA83786.1 type III pantothenate kinase [Lysobacter bugurensis]